MNEVVYKTPIFFESMENAGLPNENEIFIIGTQQHPKWAYLRCPCGCTEILGVTLMKSIQPHWSVEFDENQCVTFSPSIRVVASQFNCKSHFFIRHNKVVWCY